MSSQRSAVGLCWFAALCLICAALPCLAKEPRSARDYFERGLARAQAGESGSAIEDFTNAIALNSRLDTRALKHAKILEPNLENKRRTGLGQKVLVIDQFNAKAYYNRGTLLMKQGHLREAIADLDKAITLDPRSSQAFKNRAYAKYQSGDIDGAIRDYDKRIQVDPENPDTYYGRGAFRHKLQDLAGAIADYTRTIELNPRLAAAYHDRGLAYLNQSQLDEAYRDFDNAIGLDSGLFPAYLNRGLVLILQGKDTQAEADFERYLQHAGDKKDTVKNLVRIAKRLRLVNEAKALADQSGIAARP